MVEIPRRLSFCTRLKFLPAGKWLDIGAGAGGYLRFMPENSVGLDIVEDKSKSIYKWNFLDPLPERFTSEFDVVWCSNFIEHVLDPRRFLIRLRRVLRTDNSSVILIACPNTISFRKGPWRGTLAEDHVNFFNIRTLKLTIEFAGYEVLFAGCPSFPFLPLWASRLIGSIGPTILVAARPINEFQYGPGACKVINEEGEIEFIEELRNGD